MANYAYEAVDAGGIRTHGLLDVADQSEALRRIREMGLFPTRVAEKPARTRIRTGIRRTRMPASPAEAAGIPFWKQLNGIVLPGFAGRPNTRALMVFTRQLATLTEAGMPLLRSLRTLQEQAESPALKRVLRELAGLIEGGGSLSDAMAAHPKVFNDLYLNMVKAGEIGGALELTLRRLAEFMEKSQKIKGKVKAAMFYPSAVLFVAALILAVLVIVVIPRFQLVFQGLLNGASMPPFTEFVMHISGLARTHFAWLVAGGLAAFGGLAFLIRTRLGRAMFDRMKLTMPVLGPVFRKAAISRFSRTLGTLLNSGVPILQALVIVRNTAGNVVLGRVISRIHDSVKQGDSIAMPLKASRVFPPMVAGMVDVGEQTGALPDMLMKIADGYEDEVDNAVSAMTSLLEPIMILFLAVVVGSIVVAMFLPLLVIMERGFDPDSDVPDL